MSKDIEELRFVADLAHNGGMMQAENEHLKRDNAKLQVEIEHLKKNNVQQQGEIVKLQDENRRLRAEMDVMKYSQAQSQPTVVVNNFYMLSVPKTHDYVCKLDNDGRRFVGHFMHHTLPDNTQRSIIDEVDEMTQLAVSQDDRLADAMEKLASKPTTQNNYGDHVEGDKVGEKNVVPRIENFKPEIQTQSNCFTTSVAGGQGNELPEG